MSISRYPDMNDSTVEWLGDIPNHWNIVPVKRGSILNDETLPESTDEEFEFDYVEISDVDAIGGITSTTRHRFGEAPSRARRVLKPRDVVISTVRTYLRAIAQIPDTPQVLIGSTGFAVLRGTDSGLQSGYLGYLLRAEWFISKVISRSTGVSYPAISASDLVSLSVPLPSREEQSKIACFLDHETAKIDALIAEQQRLIELLKEKRQAVISHAVTKGLAPNVPMKDTGVEWLGTIPSHWKARPLKHLIAQGTSISYGIVQPGEHTPGGHPFIQTSNLSSGGLDLETLQCTTKEIEAGYPRSRLKGGEVILGIRASIGAAQVVPEILKGANLSRGIARIEPSKELEADYLALFLCSRHSLEYWEISKQGSTFSEVSIATVRELTVTIPPRAEQASIVNFLAQFASRIDELISQGQRLECILSERRSSLISAAVTGKIDVRNWQPSTNESAFDTEVRQTGMETPA